ncbi:carboxypeptidase-like regulatory domain-containing protein [Psychroserpens luteus]|uniref:Carboxypeptidase-like regulatory domain-containing protein n=1 Tax=Psychroserpens luteus TaxID=1434066 RepID=A0ABW6A1W1_9FLAO|nr:carboxypeptidase-like regulatory domain-containing protein [Psychroserpens luteus]
MRTSLNINIPEPCHEDWSKMTLQQKGRHCTSCEKTVFDFTTKTDEQIVKTFLDEGKVCGRFKSTQLNRELVLTRKEKNNYLSYVASTLFAFLSFGTQDVEAQGKPRIVKVDSLQYQMVNGKIGTSILNTKPISGTVFNSEKFPIPNVEIFINNSANSTTSDSSGNFTIKVELGSVLIIKASSYETAEITINDFGKRQIYLKTNSIVISNKQVQTETKNINEKLIKGNIIAKSDGLPLPGVTIVNLRTKVETYSDFDGNFSLKAKTGDSLKYKFYGMLNVESIIDNESIYNIELSENPCERDAYIVAGTATYSSDYIYKRKCKQLKKQARRTEKQEKIKNGELERTQIGKLLYNMTNIFRRKE